MKAILRMIKDKHGEMAEVFMREYIKTRYGTKSDLCIVFFRDGGLIFKTDNTSGYRKIANDIGRQIRRLVGDNILMLHGIPQPDVPCPKIGLMLMPSAARALGFRGSRRFIKDWPGDSKAGEISVVEYFILGKGLAKQPC